MKSSGISKAIQNILPFSTTKDKAEIKANLKRNWYFPISAMAFFCLSMSVSLGYFIGLLIVFAIMIVISGQCSSVLSVVKKHSVLEIILGVLTSAGICLANRAHFIEEVRLATDRFDLPQIISKIAPIVSYVGVACAMFFVLFCVLVFFAEMKRIVLKTGLIDNVTPIEWGIYALLLVVSIGFMAFTFSRTQAFYGTDFSYDIIYTSDSPSLVKGNAYLTLTHLENDLRQPLFAVFAAPFVGIPYLIARLIGATLTVQTVLVNGAQIVMLFGANFMVAKMLKLDSVKRICFMVLSTCTYTQLLFVLMMEQYIVAYFWLVFCMYLICEKQQPNQIALWGAGGTLLTSAILLPFMSGKSPIKEFKGWLTDMIKRGIEFAVFLLAFCRFDVIYYLASKLSFISGFTGKALTLTDKIYRYTEFIGNCFVAPDAVVNTSAVEHASWRMKVPSSFCLAGILILVLVVVSAIWNRDKKSSLLAIGWVSFSVVMLLGLGWGMQENGLILYALYFGWAFLALLFQLVEKIESKLKVKFLVPAVTILAAATLLIINIPQIMKMVDFAIAHYPA